MTGRARRFPSAFGPFLFFSLVIGGCAHHPASTPPTASAPPPTMRLALHWNDAADTTRTLRWPSDKPFRLTMTIAGVADSVRGFEMHFRLEPTTASKGTAWKFAATPECSAAIWSATVERDPKARAPWPNKLAITDARPMDDGSVFLVVTVAFDQVKVDPDSTYSLGHMDFQPPEPLSSNLHCAGWDAPMRIFAESASALLTENVGPQPVPELGKPLYFEPH